MRESAIMHASQQARDRGACWHPSYVLTLALIAGIAIILLSCGKLGGQAVVYPEGWPFADIKAPPGCMRAPLIQALGQDKYKDAVDFGDITGYMVGFKDPQGWKHAASYYESLMAGKGWSKKPGETDHGIDYASPDGRYAVTIAGDARDSSIITLIIDVPKE
jgi:hypothetical protein